MPIALSAPVPGVALDAAFASAGGASQEAARGARGFDHLDDLEAEYGFTPLSTEGALPDGLEGTLFRVGPARATLFGVRVPHPFEADRGSPGAPEGDGHVLALVTGVMARKSAVHVWDAAHLDDGPLSRIHLLHASPQTFHGTFVPRER